jgi:hypothetical protein
MGPCLLSIFFVEGIFATIAIEVSGDCPEVVSHFEIRVRISISRVFVSILLYRLSSLEFRCTSSLVSIFFSMALIV